MLSLLRCLIPSVPALPPPAAARRSSPWHGRGRAQRSALGAPAPIGRAWHRACPGPCDSAPEAGACPAPREGERLAIVAGGWLDVWRVSSCGTLAQEAQGIRLIAAFLVRLGEGEGTLGQLLHL